ncbi:MAG: DUF3293 domain-containing protein [Burkholderiales bacterium]
MRYGGHTLRIYVDQENLALDKLLRQQGARCWGFITAWNPRSRVLPRWRNQGHNAVLRRELSRTGYRALPASSDGPDYAAEIGFLVLNAGTSAIRRLGRKFGQNAVLGGARGAKARLLWCDSSR